MTQRALRDTARQLVEGSGVEVIVVECAEWGPRCYAKECDAEVRAECEAAQPSY